MYRNDGDQIMNKDERKRLPKIELHCHLDGSLAKESIEELLGREVKEEELQVRDDCKDLAQYLEKFDLPLSVLQNEEGLRSAGEQFIKQVSEENVIYAEVRFAPLLSVNDNMSCRKVIQSLLDGLEIGRQKYKTQYNVIVCAMRHHSEKENLEMVQAAREYIGKGVCAVDLAGNEAAYPMYMFRNLFKQVKQWKIPFTIHAGECQNVDNITESIHLGAKRIGHGIAMRNNKEVMELCRRNKIGIEMCPISNVQTKAIDSIENYPMKEFLQNNLYVTINTDNRTVSNSTICKEIEFVQKNCEIEDEEIIRMMKNAVEVSFATDEIKEQLRKQLSLL